MLQSLLCQILNSITTSCLFRKECLILIKETVLYKGIECKIIWEYGNGNYEILCLGEVVLVDKSECKNFFLQIK